MHAMLGAIGHRPLRGVDTILAPESTVSGERRLGLRNGHLSSGCPLCGKARDELEYISGPVEDQQASRIGHSHGWTAATASLQRREGPCADQSGRVRASRGLRCG